jgi:hypothetical protein
MFSAAKTSAPVSGAYTLSKSLRFRNSASAYLNRTFGSGNRTTWTYSAWIKRGLFGSPTKELFTAASGGEIFLGTGNNLIIYDNATTYLTTTQIFQDPSAWYHIVIVWDTTQATSSNRIKFYVNGSQVTSFSTSTYPAQNTTSSFNNSTNHNIGEYYGGGSYYFDGYMADINFIDGQALTPSSFGSTNATTGQWSPAKYSGSYGTNGFHLTFANTTSTTTLGYDTSGNSNNWTTNNISLTAGSTYDSMNDVPTLSATASNYAVLNPNNTNSSTTLSNGNLNYSVPVTPAPSAVFSTIGLTTGKWYAELTLNSTNFFFGVWGNGSSAMTPSAYTTYYFDIIAYGSSYFSLEKSSGSITGSGGTLVVGNVYALAVDIDGGTISFYQNNSLIYTLTGMSFTGPLFVTIGACTGSLTSQSSVNFGQQGFTYTPPSGYKALNTYNLPTPTIAQGNAYMNAVLQLGSAVNTGANLFAQSGYTYGLAWGKDRTSSNNNQLVDTVRGTSNVIQSNTTSAETTYSAPTSSDNCVAWVWNAQNASGANSNGTITSTVSVSTTAGFSVVTWTYNGSGTIGHGLGAVPQMIIQKDRTSGTYNWDVYHVSIGNTKRAILNSSAAPDTVNVWNNTTPTTSVFSIGSAWFTNGDNVVSYCFAPIAGFSAFGSYTGNGSTSGPFIYCGFQPKWIMVKRTDSTGDWTILDTSRNTYNTLTRRLYADLSASEDTDTPANALSNGFQVAGTLVSWNASGGTYIYACFASNPFQYSNAF